MKRTTIWGSVLVALVMSLLVAPQPAAARIPVDHASFNVVAPWGTPAQRWRIVHSVESAIANVPRRSARNPDPTILIATFMLDRRRTVNQLIKACKRGVSVRVVLDDDIKNRQSRRLKRALNGDNVKDRNRDGFVDRIPKRGACGKKLTKKQRAAMSARLAAAKRSHAVKHAKALQAARKKFKRPKVRKRAFKRIHARFDRAPLTTAQGWGGDRSYVKVCKGACRGPGINMHSKFYVFSSTGPYRNVVQVSSSNLNAGGALKGWNEMYTIRGRPKLYRAFHRVHREMTQDTPAGDKLVQVRSGPYTVRFFPVRRAGKANDPVWSDLSKIKCRTPLGKHKRTKVFVSMFYWRDPRGEYLAQRLLQLARKGCKVQVILGAPGRKIARQMKKASRRGLIRVYDSRWDLNGDGLFDNRTHAKFVLVKGHYGKNPRSYQVMTGSGNWVRGSLVGGDEVSLNISGKRAYQQYVRAWDRIRDHSRLIRPRRR
jgi:hypothetical protein